MYILSGLRKLIVIAPALIIGSALLLSMLFLAHAQNGQNVLEKHDWPNEPIQVISLQVGTETVSFGKSFGGGEDWADHLRVTVENSSGKAIKYLQLELRSRRTDDANAYHTFFLEWPEPLQPDQHGEPRYSDQLLRARDRATLSTHIKVAYAKRIMSQRGRGALFNRARFDISQVVFEDETIWAGGSTYRDDPDHPGRLIKIDGPQRERQSKFRVPMPFFGNFAVHPAKPQNCYAERRATRTCSYAAAGCPPGTRARCFSTLVFYVDTTVSGSVTAESSVYECAPSAECVVCAEVDYQGRGALRAE